MGILRAEPDLSQRRRERRFPCRVPVLCTVGGQTVNATVVNFGYQGLGLLLPQKVKKGGILALHYTTEPQVAARVQWVRRAGEVYEVGVSCPTGTLFWVPGLLRTMPTPPDRSEARQTLRFDTHLAAALSNPDGLARGHLADLSMGGAAFCGALAGPVGAAVQISIQPPRGRAVIVPGRIVHERQEASMQWRLGVRFDNLSSSTQDRLSKLIRGLARQRIRSL